MQFKILILIFIFCSLQLFSQSEKFGSISKQELEESSYEIDNTANAVVLFKKKYDHYKFDKQNGHI